MLTHTAPAGSTSDNSGAAAAAKALHGDLLRAITGVTVAFKRFQWRIQILFNTKEREDHAHYVEPQELVWVDVVYCAHHIAACTA